MTIEENEAIVNAQVKAHFAPKVPPPKVIIPPKVKEHFSSMLRQLPAHIAYQPDDYERSLQRSLCEQKRTDSSSARSGKKIP